jgi:hypothetical protein
LMWRLRGKDCSGLATCQKTASGVDGQRAATAAALARMPVSRSTLRMRQRGWRQTDVTTFRESCQSPRLCACNARTFHYDQTQETQQPQDNHMSSACRSNRFHPRPLVFGLALAFALLPALRLQAVVGYINLTCTNGYNYVANQLDLDGTGLSNTIMTVIGTQAPHGTRVYLWDATNQVFTAPATFSTNCNCWDRNYNLPFGKGFVIWANAQWTFTMVGTVLQGRLVNFVPGTNKLSLLCSMVPQAGWLSTDLAFPPGDGDTVYQWLTPSQRFNDARGYFAGYGWYASEPTIAVGEGFFVRHPGPDTNWVRNFTVMLAATTAARSAVASAPAPDIESCSIRNGTVTLKMNKAAKHYNVQFSTDRVNWKNVAVNQKGAIWKGAVPPGPLGFFQVVNP